MRVVQNRHMANPLMMPARRIDHAEGVAAPRDHAGPVAAPSWRDEEEAHCFVCSRHTDHFAEHDGLVEAGLAAYEGSAVVRTALWDDAEAARISEAEYQRYLKDFGLEHLAVTA